MPAGFYQDQTAYEEIDPQHIVADAINEGVADPTVDDQGNPLEAGALYFNTVSGTIRIYNGTSWSDVTGGGGGGSGVSAFNGRTGAVSPQLGDYSGSQVTNSPSGGIAATTVQAALNELDGDKANVSHTHAQSEITNLVSDLAGKAATSHTHTASQISDSTTAGRDMLTAASAAAQTALLSVAGASGGSHAKGLVPDPGAVSGTSKFLREDMTWQTPSGGGGGGVTDFNTRSGAVVSVAGDYTAAMITNTPAGSISSTDVQAAINELATEKAAATHTHAQSDVTNLTSDLAAKAPLASPALTGTPTVPTAAQDTNTTQAASTAFVLAQAGASTPVMNGTGAAGTSPRYSRQDHVHPSDTSKISTSAIGVTVQGYDADTLKSDTTAALTAGYTSASVSQGTKSSGTFTPDLTTGNVQHFTNGGSFTLAPPTGHGTLVLDQTNNGSAGTVTRSGFTKVTGDSLTTTNGHKFRHFISIGNAGSHCHTQAMQ